MRQLLHQELGSFINYKFRKLDMKLRGLIHFVHPTAQTSNPRPDLLKIFSIGKLYNVIELDNLIGQKVTLTLKLL